MALKSINPQPRMTDFLVNNIQPFRQKPLKILDVGARGGLELQWQVYKDQIYHIGIEPDLEECQKLNQQCTSQQCQFFPVALGETQEKKTFFICKAPQGSSFYPANQEFLQRFPQEHSEQLEVIKTVEMETISLDLFIQKNNIDYLDFIKLDVEGSELDILKGGKETLKKSVLGLSLEVLFHSSLRHQPTFSEIDLFLNSLGFKLFDLSTYRYSRKVLPFPTNSIGATQKGQILWGQALYFRDIIEDINNNKKSKKWNQTKILKLATMMEIFNLQDCALELIIMGKQHNLLSKNIDLLVNNLTPRINKNNQITTIPYQEYLTLF